MNHIQFTDLPHKVGNDNILLFQPETTVKAGIYSCPGRECMERAFTDTVKLTGLIHVCSVSCSSANDEIGGPYGLDKCGGNLILKPVRSVKLLRRCKPETEIALTCSNPKCNMAVTSSDYPSKPDLSNLLLHLAFKQMVPGLPIANYFDCSKKMNDHRLRLGLGDAIRALGLIAFASETLWGFVDNEFFGRHLVTQRFGLGFMFAPDMQTADECGGYDAWLKFLVEKKFESLKAAHRWFAPFLLGPKPFQRK